MDEIDGLTMGERGTLNDLIKVMFPKKSDLKKIHLNIDIKNIILLSVFPIH